MGGAWYNPMTVAAFQAVDPAPNRHRYLRPPRPLHFPVEESVPETGRHLHARTALFLLVWDAFKDSAAVGSEQFIYWDPTDPKKCCAPDLFVRLGSPHTVVDSWKVWERGAPDLVVEITSASDAGEATWETKLERFRQLGAREIVRFDPEDATRPIRIWDAMNGDVVERDPADPSFHRCEVLGTYLAVREDAEIGPMLRLARDPEGRDLLPTPSEARQREVEARQREVEARQREVEARQREVEARERAERRILELEAELAKHR
jgi:hypothetical protein